MTGTARSWLTRCAFALTLSLVALAGGQHGFAKEADTGPIPGASVRSLAPTPDLPAQLEYLKASNTDSNDAFGFSIAASGNTVVVGAPVESSSATGVNGNSVNNSAPDSGAAYVFVNNGGTWTQQAYLKASNTGVEDNFGISVAISGDTIIVGAWKEDSGATGVNGNEADNTQTESGAAYVFVRSGTTWTQQAYLKASNSGDDDFFGWSVAISGDTAVVGAFGDDSSATTINGDASNNGADGAGSAFVFVRTGTVWSQQAYLKASNAEAADAFGSSVAISSETVVVSAPQEASAATGVGGNQANNSAPASGAAYVFNRSGTAWSLQVYLKADDTTEGDLFGSAVSIAGDTVAVGAWASQNFAGAAYVYERTGAAWALQAHLNSTTVEEDEFGYSIAVGPDIVAVGARGEDGGSTGINGNEADDSALDSGAVYVYTRSGAAWTKSAYVKASNTGEDDRFGNSVALAGALLAVGAREEASSATGPGSDETDDSATGAGAAYVFSSGAPVPHDVHGCDGTVNGLDALAVLRVLAGFETGTLPTAPCNADFDGNTVVDLADAIAVRREVAGL